MGGRFGSFWCNGGVKDVQDRSLPVYQAGSVEVPFVIAGMDEVVEQHIRWAPHSHPTHELLWNERGTSTVTIGRRTWTITPTIGFWIPAGVLHSGVTPAGTWYRTTHFAVDAVPALADEPVVVEIDPLLRLLLQRLLDDLEEQSRALTEAMVLDVLRPAPAHLLVQVPATALLRPLVDAVLQDPADPRTLAEWAESLGVSTRTLTRAFRSEVGHGFNRWVATVRAQRAVDLFALGHPVDEVARRLGYASISAFGAAFRRTTGLTPGAFQWRRAAADPTC